MAGTRPPDVYDAESDPSYGEALQRYANSFEAQRPGDLPPLPEMGPGPELPPASWRTWLADFQAPTPSQAPLGQRLMNLLPGSGAPAKSGPSPDLSRLNAGPTASEPPVDDAQWNALVAEGLALVPKKASTAAPRFAGPASAPSTRGPMVSAPAAKVGQTRGPKTQLALHFARVMGMESDAPTDSPEELAFAKAAHQAMLKMSKGQSVAKFLSQMNSAKASATFQALMNQQMAKSRPQPSMGASKPPLNPS